MKDELSAFFPISSFILPPLAPCRMTDYSRRVEQRQAAEQQLIENIAAARNELTALLSEVSGHWGYEDGMYRFYHQSFKVEKP
jgi:2-iminoacetate synthase ThiH